MAHFYNTGLSHTGQCSLFSSEIWLIAGLTVEEWSGLLCDSTGQHAVVRCQGRARCLCAPVFTLYLLECGAPAVVLWLKYIILLIVHTGGTIR